MSNDNLKKLEEVQKQINDAINQEMISIRDKNKRELEQEQQRTNKIDAAIRLEKDAVSIMNSIENKGADKPKTGKQSKKRSKKHAKKRSKKHAKKRSKKYAKKLCKKNVRKH